MSALLGPRAQVQRGAEREGGGQAWPGQEAWRVRLFWKQHFGMQRPEPCAAELSGSVSRSGRGARAAAAL